MSTCNKQAIASARFTIDPIAYVDPFIGMGFPGPTLQNGMVQPSLDTRLPGWDASIGYPYSYSTIYGFSICRLDGRGRLEFEMTDQISHEFGNYSFGYKVVSMTIGKSTYPTMKGS